MGWLMFLTPNPYGEVLNPQYLRYDCTGERVFVEVIKLKQYTGVPVRRED